MRSNEGWLKNTKNNNTTVTLNSHTIIPWGYNQPAENQTFASHLIAFGGIAPLLPEIQLFLFPKSPGFLYAKYKVLVGMQ